MSVRVDYTMSACGLGYRAARFAFVLVLAGRITTTTDERQSHMEEDRRQEDKKSAMSTPCHDGCLSYLVVSVSPPHRTPSMIMDFLVIGSRPAALSATVSFVRQSRSAVALSSPSAQSYQDDSATHTHDSSVLDYVPTEPFKDHVVMQRENRSWGSH
jgi:hypothetical protein